MVTPLSDDVWWYDLSGVNAYLVDDDGTLTLVDAGMPWHGNSLVAGVREAGFELRDLERILVTHYDLDHVGGLSAFDGVDLTIYVGVADAPYVTGTDKPPLTNHKGTLQRLTRRLVSAPSNPVETVADGDTVGSFTVYHTPGHTPGHVCYVSEALSTAFLGDLVRENRGALSASPWLLSYDTGAVTRSLREFIDRVPPFEVAAMGHGVPFEKGGSGRVAELAATV
ncbi:MBL fold metallo-hydrolase [Haloarcula pellucida]|uniref:MBL fold hydrolase n=1 Tax=Haloarcula pellucida TaxID=1427151 RepID=A0A830GM68_9EURY|nr:MBL fold metallo-hydrolase [Halomicroarcula pellucida]MBX0348533.1 MBL fold metallo-hydrolase [Halomicroarcula pellucida]GGN92923.1 MBL fold hydrolase [Halomicroarcula pellucida]